jgi:hypothetical protein
MVLHPLSQTELEVAVAHDMRPSLHIANPEYRNYSLKKKNTKTGESQIF